MTEKLFHVGVKALVLNGDGRVLLMEEDGSTHRIPQPNYWDLPGGRIDEEESAVAALEREIEEELGISGIGEPEFQTAVISNHTIPLADGNTVGLVLMVYKVTLPEDAEIVLSDEHAGYEWVELEEAKLRLQDKYPTEFTERL